MASPRPSLALGIAALAVSPVMGFGLGMLHQIAGVVVGGAFAVGLLLVWARPSRRWSAFAGFAAVGLLLTTFAATRAVQAVAFLADGPVTAAPSELDLDPGATVRLRDFEVLSDQTVVRSRVAPASGGEKGHFVFGMIAPIVPTGWTPDEPVPAWLECTTRQYEAEASPSAADATCQAQLDAADGTLRELDGAQRQWDPDELIAAARDEHGLTSAPDAPVLVAWLETKGDVLGELAGVPILMLIAIGAMVYVCRPQS